MALGVMLGAFGAHGLQNLVTPERIEIFETGVRYQMYHALGVLLVGILLYFRRTSLMPWAAWLFIGGIVFFSGSLYLLTFAEVFKLPTGLIGPITPIGGLLFVAAWIVLMISTFQDNEKRYSKSSQA